MGGKKSRQWHFPEHIQNIGLGLRSTKHPLTTSKPTVSCGEYIVLSKIRGDQRSGAPSVIAHKHFISSIKFRPTTRRNFQSSSTSFLLLCPVTVPTRKSENVLKEGNWLEFDCSALVFMQS